MRKTISWTPEADALAFPPITKPESGADRARAINQALGTDYSQSAVNHRHIRLVRGTVGDYTDAERLLMGKGLSPDEWSLDQARVSSWDGQLKNGGTQPLSLTELKVSRRTEQSISDEESDRLIAELRALAAKPAPETHHCPVTTAGDTAVVLFSDLHIGKLADAEMVGDNIDYSTPIALARWRFWLDEDKSILRARKPSQIVLGVIGDGVEGSQMRPGQAARTDCTIGRQSRHFADVLVATISELSEIAPVLVLILGGNHGRIGLKGEGLVEDNLEVVVGHAITHAFVGNPRVSIKVATTPDLVIEIRGKLVGFTHGDRAGRTESSLMAYLVRLQDAWGLRTQKIEVLCTAHYHTFAEHHDQDRSIICNGGFDGGACDYARNQLTRGTRPEQVIFGLDDGDGIAWREVIAVAPMRPARTLLVAEAA